MKISQKHYDCTIMFRFYNNGILRTAYYLPHHKAIPGACYKVNALLRVYPTDVRTALAEMIEAFESHKLKESDINE